MGRVGDTVIVSGSDADEEVHVIVSAEILAVTFSGSESPAAASSRLAGMAVVQQTSSWPAEEIKRLLVILGGGNDRAILTANAKSDLLAIVDLGQGDDSVVSTNISAVLQGGLGEDTISANGDSRNILVGGRGADTLRGGSGEDILIGGQTSHDVDGRFSHDLALWKILQEWNSDSAYLDRTENIRRGAGAILSGAGISLSKGSTVFDDLEQDSLSGLGGLDWYFANEAEDLIKNRRKGELLN